MLPEQEGAYLRLLCYQWNSEDQTIPEDDGQLAMLSRLADRWASLGRDVKQCFDCVAEIPGRLRNERLWHEYNRIEGLRGKRSSGGKKGMEHRWTKKPPQVINNPVITELQLSNNPDITGNREQGTGNRDAIPEKKTPKPPRALDVNFLDWWDSYPKKTAKVSAEKAWNKMKSRMPEIAAMLEKLEAQKKSTLWTKDGGRYVPNPATYLNGGRWDDAIDNTPIKVLFSEQRPSTYLESPPGKYDNLF
jgi:uncharacterized protein YdaU (DUF1376 family)